ncbi:MAG: GIY-YIG nuclease family protein [Bacteroidota bacterium]|nr:GIY-YIG nuclease family protein [Bacteroidota bacterium]MDO9615952.1 GIY-YIG nuclease family protein [Bacteroidota bacterium]
MKYTVYALHSQFDGRIYVGFSSNVEKRLKEHNSGKTKSTKGFRPWVIIFTEEYTNRIEAREKEKYYKTGIGKEKLRKLVP